MSRFERAQEPFPIPDDLRAVIDANRKSLEMLDEGRSKHQSSWDLDYTGGFQGPSLLDIRLLSDVAYLAALLEVERGKPEDAARLASSGLLIGASLRQEPALIVQLIRIAVTIRQCAAVEQLITRSEPSKAALEDLKHWLAESRELDPMAIGMLAELKFGNAGWVKMESGRLSSQAPEFVDSSFMVGPLARIGRPLITMYRLRYLEQMGWILEIQKGPRPRAVVPASTPSRWDWAGRLTNSLTNGIMRAIDSGDLYNSVLSATELGVALRLFRIDHQAYPETLSELVPTYLARLPIDPFTGQPPVYARHEAGFTLKAEGGREYALVNSALEWTVLK